MKIQISGDYGEPKADDLFWPLQKKLNDCFKKHMTGVYFNALVMLSIVFRVSGKVLDFGSEGPEKLKHIKKDSELTIDLVFPQTFWRGIDKKELKSSVAGSLLECMDVMLDKAKELNEVQDVEGFTRDVERAIAEFKEG
ncbi:hypothetical protein [Pseudoalteromonas luteoviolacea]|uniref:Uncharacterized protein n=1 Tax=Pseudoalteromonas luteoviolacea S4060-1 TaxID=1365257 RepID=A0A162C903_9GAMM|nr:hypothetical protein [Pseudoalteromonas luteoviolacea]KZN64206.1 hypothetical protein N478_22440 [Pseudoalteromonas luteoviolacea S4060-1]